MNINMSFESFEEMKEFAKKVIGAGGSDSKNQAPEETSEKQLFAVEKTAAESVVQSSNNIPVQVAPVQAAQVPTSRNTYSLDELSNAAMTLMDKGLQPQLQQLLNQFGVEALPQIPAEKYGEFATALRGLGASI